VVKIISREEIANIVHKYGDTVYKIALSQLKNPLDAEDVFPDVFLKLMKAANAPAGDGHTKAWLIRATTSSCKDLWKSAWFRKRDDADGNDSFVAAAQFESEDYADVYQEVLKLPRKYRLVVHLFYYEEMSVKEIAETLEISAGNVKLQLHRARNMLKERLAHYEF
jgi:RNA polymerase sigma-70 factor (ECF subfamily)